MKRIWSLARLALVPLVCFILPFSLTACSDDDEEMMEEHAEADGLILRLGGSSIAMVDGAAVTGGIAVPTGGATQAIDIAFLDEDGDEFTPDEEMTLDVTVADTGGATDTQVDLWSFRLNGVSAGSTTLTVTIIHEGHSDYTSPAIPVTVATP
jgi:hypothetical protein